jgi:DNA-binding Lrp family transcriptional regulator
VAEYGQEAKGYKYAQARSGQKPGDTLVVAYVLITTATGKEGAVLEQLQKIHGLSEVHQLFGQFDMIVRMETKDYDILCDEVLGKIRTIPGVTSSRTLICASFKRS